MLNKALTYLILVTGFSQISWAQNNTKSIYSSYGLGIIQSQEVNGTKGFAGSSLGLSAGFLPNTSNPMSLGGRRSTDFDFGFELNNRLQQNQFAQRTDWAGNVNYVSLAFPAWHFNKKVNKELGDSSYTKEKKFNWNTGISLSPFTAMDYDYAIEGDSATFNTLVSVGGNGSLNSLKWSNAFQINEKIAPLTFGFSLEYLFGTIVENRLKNLLSDTTSIGYQQETSQRITGGRVGLGLSYSMKLNENKVEKQGKPLLTQTFGAFYSLESGLNSDVILTTRRVEDFFRVKDTLRFDNVEGKITLPTSLRVGYGLQKGNKWALTFDYTNTSWSTYTNSVDPGSLNNFTRLSMGYLINPDRIRYTTKEIEWYRKYLWSSGLFYQSGPFSVVNNGALESINEYGISFGVGIPMKNRFSKEVSYFHLSTTYSRRGTLDNGLVREDIFRINLALNLSDKWFNKRAYN